MGQHVKLIIVYIFYRRSIISPQKFEIPAGLIS